MADQKSLKTRGPTHRHKDEHGLGVAGRVDAAARIAGKDGAHLVRDVGISDQDPVTEALSFISGRIIC